MKVILLMLLFIPGVLAGSFGVSPSTIDYGTIEPGEKYSREITIINPNDQAVELSLLSNSVALATEKDTLSVGPNSNLNTKVFLQTESCPGLGSYDNMVIIKGSGEINTGVGVKVKYDVGTTCQGDKITGFSVKEGEGIGGDIWFVVAALLLVIGIFIFRKYRLKHILWRR